MDVGVLSMRYAKALLEYAVENKAEDEIYKEMLMLSHSFTSVPALCQALDNPILASDEKQSLICNAAGIKICEEFVRFVELILQKRREGYIRSISLMYIDLYRKLKNITVGRLITACPVSEEEVVRMRSMVHKETHGKVEFETRVEPAIEGGFIFEVDTYRLDASVATQFRRVKQQFIEKNRRIV